MRYIEIMMGLPLIAVFLVVGARSVLKPRSVSLLQVCFLFYCLQFGIGPVLFPAFTYNNVTAGAVVQAWLAVYLFWGVLLGLSRLWHPPLPAVDVHTGAVQPPRNGIFSQLLYAGSHVSTTGLWTWFALLLGMRAVMHFRYGVLLSGSFGGEEVLGVPYAIRSVFQVFGGAGFALAALATSRMLARKRFSWGLFMIVALELLVGFLRGRRIVFAVAAMLLFILVSAKGGMRLKHVVVAMVIAVLMFQFVFPFFVTVRKEWQMNPDKGFIQWVSAAVDKFGRPDPNPNRKGFTHRLRVVTDQSYQVSEHIITGGETPGGAQLVNTALGLVPRVLFPAKFEYVRNTERMLSGIYGFRKTLSGARVDISTNPMFEGFSDFGLLGAVVYACLFFLVIRVLEFFIGWTVPTMPFLAALITGIALSAIAMQMEHPLASPLGKVRTSVILLVALVPLYKLFGNKQPQTPGATQREATIAIQRMS